MDFFEVLPNECPPAAAIDHELGAVWRFVPDDDIKMEYFLSFAAMGAVRPGIDPCNLASCSLFESLDCAGLKAARKLPKLRRQRLAKVEIVENAGRSIANGKGHIHFWMYSGFDPVAAVVKVI